MKTPRRKATPKIPGPFDPEFDHEFEQDRQQAEPTDPPLLWWRTLAPSVLSFHRMRLLAHLADVTIGAVDKGLVAAAVARDEAAPHLRVALALGEDGGIPEDLQWSWCALAALRRSATATRALVIRLLHDAEARHLELHGSDFEVDRLIRMASLWSQRLDGFLNVDDFVIQAIRDAAQAIDANVTPHITDAVNVAQALAAAGKRAVTPPAADKAEAPPPADTRRKGVQSVVVVPKGIGGSASGVGKEIAKSYARLLEPLPLLGPRIDARLLKTVLDLEAPWMTAATDHVCRVLAARAAAGIPHVRLPPMLLVGPPGAGKSFWAARLSAHLGIPLHRQQASGSDNRSLEGTARGWNSATPCAPAVAMQVHACANPVLLLDEIDKHTPSDRNGNLYATLLTMLDDSRHEWPDECLMSPVDLGHITWLMTANDARPLPSPLLSRLRVVQVEAPRGEHFDRLLPGLVRSIAAEMEVPTDSLPELDEAVVEKLRQFFRASKDVRRLRRAVETVLSIDAVRHVPH